LGDAAAWAIEAHRFILIAKPAVSVIDISRQQLLAAF
jgi:hypothetical protein